jgi:hypothetical protein
MPVVVTPPQQPDLSQIGFDQQLKQVSPPDTQAPAPSQVSLHEVPPSAHAVPLASGA